MHNHPMPSWVISLAAVLISALSLKPVGALQAGATSGALHKLTNSRGYEPQFNTGYEPWETVAAPPLAHTWMVFQNTSMSLQAIPWAMSVYYETPGNIGDRYARIIDDPTSANNKVLHYWLKNAVIDAGFQAHTKGRIQTGFPGDLSNAVRVYGRQRMYIHPDMNLLLSYPPSANQWWIGVILQELWSGAAWQGHPNPSRIGLTMFPFAGQMYLELRCSSGLSSTVYWDKYNLGFPLPIGEWLTVEIGYKMGNATTGRMVVVVTRESTGQREVVFDVTDWTYAPQADAPGGTGPVPLTKWNAQKLYTSDNVIHHIRDQGGVAQAYWDDFAFSSKWPPAWP